MNTCTDCNWPTYQCTCSPFGGHAKGRRSVTEVIVAELTATPTMTEQQASELLKKSGLAWSMVDEKYQPARWMVDALLNAVNPRDNELTVLRSRLKNLQQALTDVTDPIGAMRRNLPLGTQLNGTMAVLLSKDPEYYKQLASKALEADLNEVTP